MPALWQSHDDTPKPDYADGGNSSSKAASRAPLDVPPSLRGDVAVPTPDAIATDSSELPATVKKAVAGKAVALDAKLYDVDVANVFSAVVDAMTSLNMPVQSVDSPSGTVTTDWIRQNSVSSKGAASAISGLFGGDGVEGIRYRFVVRVLRQTVEEKTHARLEVRTIGQAFINRHWVNKPIQRKVSNELFSAVDERLSN